MTRTFIKSIAAAGMAAGLVLCTAGVALPAGTPPVTDPRKPARVVVVFNQTKMIAQGLTPKAAIKQAQGIVHYKISTVHYIPKGYQLAIVRAYPYLPGASVPQDTQTFMNLSAPRPRVTRGQKVAPAPVFELDHQFGSPYVYPKEAFFVLSTVKLGKRTANVAEQKYTDFKRHKSVDLIYVYWYDRASKIATEVTAELTSTKLSRSAIFQIAASVS